MKPIYEVLLGHRISEKSNSLATNLNQYTFEVHPKANKIEIAHAVRQHFSVAVEKVRTLNQKGKRKRSRTQRGKMGCTRFVKKAIVTLKEGNKIELN